MPLPPADNSRLLIIFLDYLATKLFLFYGLLKVLAPLFPLSLHFRYRISQYKDKL